MASVTTRTAGFNNVDMAALRQATIFLFILLMWIGASPMSTGGGIKTTTFVIALKNVIAILRGEDRVEIGKRQLTRLNVNRASGDYLFVFGVDGFGRYAAFDTGTSGEVRSNRI